MEVDREWIGKRMKINSIGSLTVAMETWQVNVVCEDPYISICTKTLMSQQCVYEILRRVCSFVHRINCCAFGTLRILGTI